MYEISIERKPRTLAGLLLTPVGFAFVMTAVWTFGWLYMASRHHYFTQATTWDWGNYHSIALIFKHAIERDPISGFISSWVNASGAHTPLMEATAGLMMLIFGESQVVAESVLIIYTFLLNWAGFHVIRRLFDTNTAAWSLALFACFPVSIIVSRSFLLEHPMSAFFMLSCKYLLESNLFSRWWPSILFGVFAGLASLTRVMSFVYFFGPGLVAFALALREQDRWMRVTRGITAYVAMIALAATWYGPNFKPIYAYIESVTKGKSAHLYTNGQSAVSWDTIQYYIQWMTFEGPGVPLALLMGAILVRQLFQFGKQHWAGAGMLVCAAVFALDFLVLFPSGQRIGARYFLPIMIFLAIAIVRIIMNIPSIHARRAAAIVAVVMASWHWVAITFLEPVPYTGINGRGQEFSTFVVKHAIRPVKGLFSKDLEPLVEAPSTFGPVIRDSWQLWNHRTLFSDMAFAVGLDPNTDLNVGSIITRIESIQPRERLLVFMMSDHPFIQVQTLKYEALKRGHHWFYGAAASLRQENEPMFMDGIRNELPGVDILVVRVDGISYLSKSNFGKHLPTVLAMASPEFVEIGAPWQLGDGSTIRVFRRKPANDVTPVRPPKGFSEDIIFTNGNITYNLAGIEVFPRPGKIAIKIWVRVDTPIRNFPHFFVHLNEQDLSKGSFTGRDCHAIPLDSPVFEGPGPWYVSREIGFDEPAALNIAKRDGVRVALGFLDDSPGDGQRPRLVSKSTGAEFDDNGTRVLAPLLPPSAWAGVPDPTRAGK